MEAFPRYTLAFLKSGLLAERITLVTVIMFFVLFRRFNDETPVVFGDSLVAHAVMYSSAHPGTTVWGIPRSCQSSMMLGLSS